MGDRVDTLLDEHRRQHRLLARLETLGPCAPTAANRAVMLNIMQYMRRYPDVHHHPVEDRLFAWLAERDASLAPTVERLAAEHAALARGGERLLALLREPPDAAPTGLAGEIREYATLLEAHHRLEEASVFPAARRLMGTGDWEAIAGEHAGRFADPLAGERVDAEFEALYAVLTADGSPDSAMASSPSS